MKHIRYLMAGAVVAALAIPGSIAPAQAAAGAGWRVVFSQRDLALGGGIGGLATTRPGDAWAVGFGITARGPRSVVLRWRSGHWSTVPLPALPGQEPMLDAVGASSPTNVWAQGTTLIHPSNFNSAWSELTLHWNGLSWKVTTLGSFPDPQFVYRVLALGPRDVWSFGENGVGPGLPFSRHFDGVRWRDVSVPGFIVGVSALSAHDIWGAGTLHDSHNNPVAAVMRWTGRRWLVVARPRIQGAANNAAGFDAITVLSDRNVWAAGALEARGGVIHPVVLHFNGARWQQFDLGNENAVLFQIVPDGLGGVWASDDNGNFFHFSHGRWTRIPAPGRPGYTTEVTALVHIPGTSSLWSTAVLSNGTTVIGEILKFGR